MHLGPLYILIQCLGLILALWLSLTGAFPVPAPAGSPPSAPRHNPRPQEQWAKSPSHPLWSHSRNKHRTSEGPYVSPYLTRFVENKSERFHLGRFWAHLLWEVIPEWWRGLDPPREDMLLLRAMEQPLYMRMEEVPPELVRRKGKSRSGVVDL